MKQNKKRNPRDNPWTWTMPANLPVLVHRQLHKDLIEVFPALADVPQLRNKDHLEKWSANVQSIAVDGAVQFGCVYQLQELIRKYQWVGDRALTRCAAVGKFLTCEFLCNRTNKRLKRKENARMRELLREEICNLLPPLELGDVYRYARHGPGVSNRTARGTSKFSKFSDLPYTMTPRASVHMAALLRYDDRWRGALEDRLRSSESSELGFKAFTLPLPLEELVRWVSELRNYNRVTTVPKDDQTDRPIAIEPLLNCYLQLGIDGVWRKALRHKWGYDLNDQTKNAYYAYLGSRDRTYCTLDMSSASDLVSLRLAYELLPRDWFELLYALRSPFGLLPDGSRLQYAKFSSMGNGTTFVLESVIFGAIARVATRLSGFDPADSCVYGDDMIVRSTAYYRTVCILEECGFLVNRRKSHRYGPFRESCGMDWYNGAYVRPTYIKDLRDIGDLIAVHNRLRYWAHVVLGDSSIVERTLALLRSYSKAHAFGPENMLDFSGYFHTGQAFTFAVRRVTRKTEPRDWFFGRLLVSHQDSSSLLVSRPSSIEDLAYKASLRKFGLPDKLSNGSAYDVIERENARRYRRQTTLEGLVVTYQDPVPLLTSLHGS